MNRKLISRIIAGLLALLLLLGCFASAVFAAEAEGMMRGVSLLALNGIQTYLKISYFVLVIGMVALGILTLALQNCRAVFWAKSKTKISLALGVAAVLLFMVSLQPYASVFVFALLAIKVFMRIKWQ